MNMNIPPLIDVTVKRITAYHFGQVDKLGRPYHLHPIRVMKRLGAGAPEAELHAALLHDVLEDIPGFSEDVLRGLGYTEEVIEMVRLLSRDKSHLYPEFIDRIIASGNVGAMRIKLADLYDNSDSARIASAPNYALQKQLESMAREKYKPAIAAIRAALGQHADSVLQDVRFNFGGAG